MTYPNFIQDKLRQIQLWLNRPTRPAPAPTKVSTGELIGRTAQAVDQSPFMRDIVSRQAGWKERTKNVPLTKFMETPRSGLAQFAPPWEQQNGKASLSGIIRTAAQLDPFGPQVGITKAKVPISAVAKQVKPKAQFTVDTPQGKMMAYWDNNTKRLVSTGETVPAKPDVIVKGKSGNGYHSNGDKVKLGEGQPPTKPPEPPKVATGAEPPEKPVSPNGETTPKVETPKILYRGIGTNQKAIPEYVTPDIEYARSFGRKIETYQLRGDEKIADFTKGANSFTERMKELGFSDNEITKAKTRQGFKNVLREKGYHVEKHFDTKNNGELVESYILLEPEKYKNLTTGQPPVKPPEPPRKPVWQGVTDQPSTQVGGGMGGGTIPPTRTNAPSSNWQPSGRKPGGIGNQQPSAPTDPYAKLQEALTPTKKGLKDKITDTKNKFLSEIADRIDVFRGLEAKTGIPVHKVAQLVSGASAYGEDVLRRTVRPILGTLKEDEIKRLEEFMVLRRSQDILARYKGAKLPGGIDGWSELLKAEEALKKKVGDATFTKLEQTAKELYRINDEQVLKPLLDEGIISPDAYRDLKASNPHYIDFYREKYSVLDDIDNRMRNPEASVSKTGIESLTPEGSIEKLDSPLARMETQIIRVRNIIARNQASRNLVAGLGKLEKQSGDSLVKYINPGDKAEHSTLRDTVNFFYKGERYTVEVPKAYAVAAKNMDSEFGNAVTNFISNVNAPFRAGATTYNPAFVIINPMRDAISAWFRERLIPFSPDYIKGWIAAITKNETFSEVAKQGGLMSGLVETQRTTSKLAKSATRGALQVHNIKDAATFLPRLLEEMNVAGERATRIATYIKLRGKGVDALEAAVRARDVTVDFSKSGNTMRLINQVIPFSNASLQGAVNTLRTIKEKPWLALAATAPLAFASIAARVNNSRFETSKDIPQYEYRYNWVFQFGEATDKEGKQFPLYLKVPKGPQGSVLCAIPELVLDLAWHNNDRSVIENFLNMGGSMVTGLSPIEPSLSGIMPSALGTATGIATNKDLFRGVPIVPQSEQALSPEQQFGTDTSSLAVAVGQRFKVSPRLVDYAIKDYFAGTGQTLNWVAGMGLEALGFNPTVYGEAQKVTPVPEQQVAKTPVIQRFLGVKGTQSELVGWDNYNEAVKVTNREFSKLPDMTRLGVRLGAVGDTLSKLELSPQERANYQSLMADTVLNGMRTLNLEGVTSDEERRKLATKRIEDLKEVAKQQYIMSEFTLPHEGDDTKTAKLRSDLRKAGEYKQLVASKPELIQDAYSQALRRLFPDLDAALYNAGITQSVKTDEARQMVESMTKTRISDKEKYYMPSPVNMSWQDRAKVMATLDKFAGVVNDYKSVESVVWSQYPPELKQLADYISSMEQVDSAKARRLIRQCPAILMARRNIALIKKRMLAKNRNMDKLLDLFSE